MMETPNMTKRNIRRELRERIARVRPVLDFLTSLRTNNLAETRAPQKKASGRGVKG